MSFPEVRGGIANTLEQLAHGEAATAAVYAKSLPERLWKNYCDSSAFVRARQSVDDGVSPNTAR